jgi:Thiol:disulfide interchange protein DsbD, N-terminal
MAKVWQRRRRSGAWHTFRFAVLSVGVLLAVLFIARSKAAVAPATAGKGQADVGLNPAATATPEIVVPVPKGTNRVTAAALFHPATAHPGETVTLLVKARIAPGHWIYALDDSGSRNVATTVITESGRPFRLAEPWRSPEPKVKSDGSRIYAGEVALQGRFEIDRAAADGTQRLPVTFRYQVCNEALCWPPSTISLEPVLKVVRSP